MPELRKLRSPTQTQSDILTARATQALTSPLSTEMAKVLQQTVGLDTFQLSPSFVDPTNASRLNPTARLTIGKRISDRAFLTFSRSLNTTFNDQIIQLEFDRDRPAVLADLAQRRPADLCRRIPREARVLDHFVRSEVEDAVVPPASSSAYIEAD